MQLAAILLHHPSVQAVSNLGVTGGFLERTDKHGVLEMRQRNLGQSHPDSIGGSDQRTAHSLFGAPWRAFVNILSKKLTRGNLDMTCWFPLPLFWQAGYNKLTMMEVPGPTVDARNPFCTTKDTLQIPTNRGFPWLFFWCTIASIHSILVRFAKGYQDFNFLPTNGFAIKPLKVIHF